MTAPSEILGTRSFRERFLSCLASYPQCLRMVVPYVGVVHPWTGMTNFSAYLKARECEFMLVTAPPDSGNASLSQQEALQIGAHGSNVIFRSQPFLHSKIYQFVFPKGDRAAFVGSANFTGGGFWKNDETVAFFREKEENDAVARQIDFLAAHGLELQQWRAKQRC